MSTGRQLGREGGYTMGESKQKLDSTRTDCNTLPFLLSLTLRVCVLVLQKPGTFIIELNTPLSHKSEKLKRDSGEGRAIAGLAWPHANEVNQ